MSRIQHPSTRPSFASRMGFESLAVEDVHSSSDSEPEEETTPPPVEAVPPPVDVAQASKPIERQPSAQSRSSAAKSAKRAAKKAAAGKTPSLSIVAPQSEPESDALGLSVSDVPAEVKPNGIAEPTPTPAAGLGATASATSPRERSPLRPLSASTSSFHPTLPDSLPQPVSPGLGPRKRKASQDLKSNPLPKDPKLEAQSSDGTHPKGMNGVATAVTETGEKIGVVELALKEAVSKSVSQERAKGTQQVITRTVWTLIMIGGFVGLLLAGPVYMILLVMGIQTQVYREVTNLFGLTSKIKDESVSDAKKRRDPWSKTLNWYFFVVTNYYLYGESMVYYFKHVVYANVRFLPFANNHRIISFMLYTFGFMGFVASLKKQFLRQQFGLFGWVHMSLFVIVFSSHFIINNILEGMIWFWLPACLVICNDIFAYIWGKLFGRTQLIALSPKKTVEGFVGAFFSTLVFGVAWAMIFMRYNYMICPAVNLGANAFSNVQCDPNPAFVWRTFTLPDQVQAALPSALHIPPITWAPFLIHALVMATFASLVAPFGGFFASGFKRAFDLKDFGDSIPGHGGLTDRMDCQFLMGMFAYVYYSSVVRVHSVTVGEVMQTIVSNLSLDEQVTLFHDLKGYLETVVDVAMTARR